MSISRRRPGKGGQFLTLDFGLWGYLAAIVFLGAFTNVIPVRQFPPLSFFGQLPECADDPSCCTHLPEMLPRHSFERHHAEVLKHRLIFALGFALFATGVLVAGTLPGWFRLGIWLCAMLGLYWRLQDWNPFDLLFQW